MTAQVSTRSNTMVLARYYAKQAVKEWKRQGLRPHHIAASQLNLAADAYLTAHPELIAFATEQYQSFVESGRLKPPRERRKPSQ